MHMASSIFTLTFVLAFLSMVFLSHQQPPLVSTERESLFHVLDSINSDIPWRSLFNDDDDICISAPHGVVCDYPLDSDEVAHIVELSFGYVSDESPNPPCSVNSTLDPLLFTSFKYLRKLFFYRCFNESVVSMPEVFPSFASSLEELVFIENPSLVGPLSGIVLRNYTSLRRLVLSGNGVHGEIPRETSELVSLEELTLSRNKLSGEVPESLALLKKLKILDLSQNGFQGYVPESLGNLTELVKLDLSLNMFNGKIPESFRNLQSLEFLDLSYNKFGNFGVPQFIGEVPKLREIYLSGNLLGGKIPDIWENLGGVTRIGFSNMGLTGNIPPSMGVYLRNLSYLGLDNNSLVGPVPEEFVFLNDVDEINMENNNLSGRVPFSTKTFGKLKLGGNRGLCVDHQLSLQAENKGCLGQLKLCNKPVIIPDAVLFNGISSLPFDPLMWFISLGLLFVFTVL